MAIDESDEHFANAWSSIYKSRDRGSKVTVERREHSEKQWWVSLSTEAGIQIEESE
jgi:hypothetical protein